MKGARHKSHILDDSHLHEIYRISKSMEADNLRLPVAGGNREWGVTANEYEISSGDDESVLELDSGHGCTTL